MKVKDLYFSAPRQVTIRENRLPNLEDHQVLVKSHCSIISPGTEMLIYRGDFPKGLTDSIDPYTSNLSYPLKFGYANVGRVMELGREVSKTWQDRVVFAFQSHGSHFITTPETLISLPDGCSPESACFLANMETSVNLVQDSAPILGEDVLVLGQGIVGLLTTALLAEFPLETLVTTDLYPLRRNHSIALGASASFDPVDREFWKNIGDKLPEGADLTIELTGSPTTLNDAIALTGYGGRIVVGSWYGERQAPIDLGGKFHRSRLRIISSQVSTISGVLSDRWDKSRRFDTAWSALKRIKPERWITHRYPIEEAGEAYRMLDQSPKECLQILFEYT